jgi:hypothetical protein
MSFFQTGILISLIALVIISEILKYRVVNIISGT